MHPLGAGRRGFTLIEMAVVLVVLGLVSGILIAPLAMRIEASQRHSAETQLDDIVDALIGFALIHGRLPCPSIETDPAHSSYGLEHSPPCALSVTGYLPWRTLGLPALDPWGGLWRYRPDKHFAEGLVSVSTAPSGLLKIKDHRGELISLADSIAVAVIFSAGANRQPDGLNAAAPSASPVFESGEATPTFDDQLRWIGRPLLIARLARGGRL